MYFTRVLRSQQQSLAHLVEHYAQYPPTGLTMKKIVEFGEWMTMMMIMRIDCLCLAREGDAQQSYLFLRNELPVRLASMMKEMDHLPPRLLQMPSVKIVNGWYGTSLTELHTFKGLKPNKDVVQKYELFFPSSSYQSSLFRRLDSLESYKIFENDIRVWWKH